MSGDFASGANWVGGVAPAPNNDAILNATGSTAYTVTSSTNETVLSILTAANATLLIASGSFTATNGTGTGGNAGAIDVAGGAVFACGTSLTNSGTIMVGGTGSGSASVVIESTATLSGAGNLTLSDSSGNQITGGASAATLTNVSNTISGAGAIGSATLTLVNQKRGTIDASGTNGFVLDTGANTIVNGGLIEGTGSGGLTIRSAVSNAGGTLSAGAGSQIFLQGADLIGGTLETAGAGVIVVAAGRASVFDGAASAIDDRAVIEVASGAALYIGGSIANAGSIMVGGPAAGDQASMAIEGVTTLSGAGNVTLSDLQGNQIIGGASAATLTNVDNTLSGSGTIGSATLTLVNQAGGTIDATGTNGLDLSTGANTIVNAGVIEATGSGGLTIQGAVANTGGTLSAAAGSDIALLNAEVFGGTLATSGSGRVLVEAGAGSVLDGTSSTLTDRALIVVAAKGSLTIQGAIANGDVIQLNGRTSIGPTLMIGAVGVTLSGGGALLMYKNAANRIIGATSAATLTNVDNRIGGAGQLGGGQLTLVNGAAGRIFGNQATGLVIDTGANTIVNDGWIVARGAGGVTIASAVDNNGRLESVGSGLTVQGAVTGTGEVFIAGGTMNFASAFSQNVNFFLQARSGTLELAQSQAFNAMITGFSSAGATTLDLADIAFVSSGEAIYKKGVLTVTDGSHTAAIKLRGDYRGVVFTASSDGHGGTNVVAGSAPAGAHAFVEAMAGLGAASGAAISTATAAGPAPLSLIAPGHGR